MGMLPALARRWQSAQSGSAGMIDRGATLSRGLAASSRSLRMILQVGVIAAGATLVIDNLVTPGSMMAAGLITGRLLHPFEQLVDGWRQWVKALEAHRRIRDLLNNGASARSTMPLPQPQGALTVDRVTHVPSGLNRPILRNVTFAVQAGEVLGVIGPSGAGKSTLARLLVGVWQPTAGGIYLDGTSTYLWERESFGKYVGYVPQSVALLDGTIGENISRMASADPAEIVRAARLAGVHEMIGRLPFGYDTPVGDSAFSLSGGQRQRIALARALFGRPRLLVLDEPNSNLDHDGEQALLSAVQKVKADGTTVVMIAHRPSIVAIADKLVVMKDGAVEHFGARNDVLKVVQPGGAPAAENNDEQRYAPPVVPAGLDRDHRRGSGRAVPARHGAGRRACGAGGFRRLPDLGLHRQPGQRGTRRRHGDGGKPPQDRLPSGRRHPARPAGQGRRPRACRSGAAADGFHAKPGGGGPTAGAILDRPGPAWPASGRAVGCSQAAFHR
ncbi:hypothetical protein Lal_00013655 [Lupinus albus]|nr:hypothetical protein Lal_00013655 [Lupinus albus]